MKISFTILAVLLMTANVWAQSPEKMSYQAVIRNSDNELVTNTTIGIQISILQGSAGGTVVYTETQTPTTNQNGLVSIEIGGGAGFSSINWANDIYFIKSETDPTGGTNYTITGTSQLLSVPYALHAKTADSVTGIITETDPVFTNSEAVYITAQDITNLMNLSGVNTGDQDGSETIVTAGTNVTVTGSGTTANPYVVNSTGATPLAIGDSYQGGIIFWLDTTGQHGLITATANQGLEEWFNGTNRYTGTTGDGLYAGDMNTAMIVAQQMADNQTGNFAAKACADYSVTDGGVTYGDWYLPSKYELDLLYQQRELVGISPDGYYWSSTEYDNDQAWRQYFTSGGGTWNNDGKDADRWVRAIRAF